MNRKEPLFVIIQSQLLHNTMVNPSPYTNYHNSSLYDDDSDDFDGTNL